MAYHSWSICRLWKLYTTFLLTVVWLGVWCRYGVVFRGLREKTVTLEVLGHTKIFSRLQVLDFDSGQYFVVTPCKMFIGSRRVYVKC